MFIRYIPFSGAGTYPDVAAAGSTYPLRADVLSAAWSTGCDHIFTQVLEKIATGGLKFFDSQSYAVTFQSGNRITFTDLAANRLNSLGAIEKGAVVELSTTASGLQIGKVKSVSGSSDITYEIEIESTLPNTTTEFGNIVYMKRAGLGYTIVSSFVNGVSNLALKSIKADSPLQRLEFRKITSHYNGAGQFCSFNVCLKPSTFSTEVVHGFLDTASTSPTTSPTTVTVGRNPTYGGSSSSEWMNCIIAGTPYFITVANSQNIAYSNFSPAAGFVSFGRTGKNSQMQGIYSLGMNPILNITNLNLSLAGDNGENYTKTINYVFTDESSYNQSLAKMLIHNGSFPYVEAPGVQFYMNCVQIAGASGDECFIKDANGEIIGFGFKLVKGYTTASNSWMTPVGRINGVIELNKQV